MRTVITIARVLTGALFIFSGLVKAIDPRGLAYKMQEFFEVFAREGYLPGMMNALNDHALTFSIIMITMEVVLGVALLLGWKKKLTLWLLLLLIILFTFLTSFVLFSGKIKACGCFGDCIPITPLQTFAKDIILLILILLLLFKREFIRPLNKPLILTIIVVVSTALTLALQFYVLKHLPVVDCLPFKKGNNILDQRKMPADAVPDEYTYTFIYEKDGEKKEFTTDFPDSTWVFVDRKQVLVKQGKNNLPPINDYKLNTAEGIDSTELLMNSGETYYLFYLEFPTIHTNKWIEDMRTFASTNAGKSKIFLVTSQRNAAEKFLIDNKLLVDGIFTTDATAIKTAARSNPTIYRMKGAVVEEKWGWGDFGKL